MNSDQMEYYGFDSDYQSYREHMEYQLAMESDNVYYIGDEEMDRQEGFDDLEEAEGPTQKFSGETVKYGMNGKSGYACAKMGARLPANITAVVATAIRKCAGVLPEWTEDDTREVALYLNAARFKKKTFQLTAEMIEKTVRSSVRVMTSKQNGRDGINIGMMMDNNLPAIRLIIGMDNYNLPKSAQERGRKIKPPRQVVIVRTYVNGRVVRRETYDAVSYTAYKEREQLFWVRVEEGLEGNHHGDKFNFLGMKPLPLQTYVRSLTGDIKMTQARQAKIDLELKTEAEAEQRRIDRANEIEAKKKELIAARQSAEMSRLANHSTNLKKLYLSQGKKAWDEDIDSEDEMGFGGSRAPTYNELNMLRNNRIDKFSGDMSRAMNQTAYGSQLKLMDPASFNRLTKFKQELKDAKKGNPNVRTRVEKHLTLIPATAEEIVQFLREYYNPVKKLVSNNHEVTSDLNGNNGEDTGEDDHKDTSIIEFEFLPGCTLPEFVIFGIHKRMKYGALSFRYKQLRTALMSYATNGSAMAGVDGAERTTAVILEMVENAYQLVYNISKEDLKDYIRRYQVERRNVKISYVALMKRYSPSKYHKAIHDGYKNDCMQEKLLHDCDATKSVASDDSFKGYPLSMDLADAEFNHLDAQAQDIFVPPCLQMQKEEQKKRSAKQTKSNSSKSGHKEQLKPAANVSEKDAVALDLKCEKCGAGFVVTKGMCLSIKKKGYVVPKYCVPCRAIRNNEVRRMRDETASAVKHVQNMKETATKNKTYNPMHANNNNSDNDADVRNPIHEGGAIQSVIDSIKEAFNDPKRDLDDDGEPLKYFNSKGKTPLGKRLEESMKQRELQQARQYEFEKRTAANDIALGNTMNPLHSIVDEEVSDNTSGTSTADDEPACAPTDVASKRRARRSMLRECYTNNSYVKLANGKFVEQRDLLRTTRSVCWAIGFVETSPKYNEVLDTYMYMAKAAIVLESYNIIGQYTKELYDDFIASKRPSSASIEQIHLKMVEFDEVKELPHISLADIYTPPSVAEAETSDEESDEIVQVRPTLRVATHGYAAIDNEHMLCLQGGGYYKVHEEGDLGSQDTESIFISHGVELEGYARASIGVYVPKDGSRCISSEPVFKTSIVISAKLYRWFANTRETLRKLGHVVTLGQAWDERLFTGFSTKKESVLVSKTMLAHLQGLKSMSNVTELNVKLHYDKLNNKYPEMPMELKIGTSIYFVEKRTMLQKNILATTQACEKFLQNKLAYVHPVSIETEGLSGVRTAKSKAEGVYQFSSAEESEKYHNDKMTCVQRVEYTKSDDSYGSWDNRKIEAGKKFLRRAGNVDFLDPYVKFSDEREKPVGYSSVACSFENNSDIIDHGSGIEISRALLRITAARDNEVEKRMKAVVYNTALFAEVKKLIRERDGEETLWTLEDEDAELCSTIRRNDPRYAKDDNVIKDYTQKHGAAPQLTEEDMDRVKVHAAWLYCQTKFQLSHSGDRLVDEHSALLEYIDETGAKVPLRKKMVNEYYSTIGADRIKCSTAQIKPHEAQKWKINKETGLMRLKFARLVISIVGNAWILANPGAACDVKKVTETPVEVFYRMEENNKYYATVDCGIVGMEVEVSKRYKPFRYEACLTRTDLDSIAALISRMHEFSVDNDGVAATSHGDDMLLVSTSTVGGRRETKWVEGDIADNDGSHCDTSFHVAHAITAVRRDGLTEAFAQCANPIAFRNPTNNEQILLVPRYGMLLPSGSILTTYKNTLESAGICLGYSMSSEGDISASAAVCGFDVTTPDVDTLERVCFLSKNFYTNKEGVVKAMTDIASILRSFGKVVGDFNGSSREAVHLRAMKHINGVIKSFVHEPDSIIMRVLRSKDTESRTDPYTLIRRIFKAGYIHSDLNDVDRGLIMHSYGEENFESGVRDYLYACNLINSQPGLYGKSFYLRFVDSAMAMRYQLSPVVQNE